jgi:hypothetical protein
LLVGAASGVVLGLMAGVLLGMGLLAVLSFGSKPKL